MQVSNINKIRKLWGYVTVENENTQPQVNFSDFNKKMVLCLGVSGNLQE